MSSTGATMAEIRSETTDLLEKKNSVEDRLRTLRRAESAAKARSWETGKYVPSDVWELLQKKIDSAVGELAKINIRLRKLKDRRIALADSEGRWIASYIVRVSGDLPTKEEWREIVSRAHMVISESEEAA